MIAGLIVAQSLAALALLRSQRSVAGTETTAILLVSAVGAALALVSQTYHIPGSLDSFYRTWLWLIVAIPYVTGSAGAAVLFWALLMVRVTSEVTNWHMLDSDSLEPWLIRCSRKRNEAAVRTTR